MRPGREFPLPAQQENPEGSVGNPWLTLGEFREEIEVRSQIIVFQRLSVLVFVHGNASQPRFSDNMSRSLPPLGSREAKIRRLRQSLRATRRLRLSRRKLR